MAFQGNAFQGNAFQIGIPGGGAVNVVLDADSATYNYTANNATFDTKLLVANAAYAYSATAVTFDTRASTATASYAYTANGATFDTRMAAASASYAYTANAATFDTSMLAASAAYVYTANDADLVVEADGDVIMDAESASYAYSATAVTFDTRLSTASASYAYTANDATLTANIAGGDEDILLGGGTYQGLRRRLGLDGSKRWQQLEKLSQRLEDIEELPSDVPEAEVARQAKAAVEKAVVRLVEAHPYTTVDYKALGVELAKARAAVKRAEAAYHQYLEDDEDEDLLLMAA